MECRFCQIIAGTSPALIIYEDEHTATLFVQGGGKDVHDQWDSKLVESLEHEHGPGYRITSPDAR